MNDFIYCKTCNGYGVTPHYPHAPCPYCKGTGKTFTNLQNTIEESVKSSLEKYKKFQQESGIKIVYELPEVLKSIRNKKLLLLTRRT